MLQQISSMQHYRISSGMIVCGQIAEQRVGIGSTARTYAMRKTFQFHSTLSAHKFSKHVKIKLFIKIYFCRHGSQF